MSFNGTGILITGASQGLGYEAAKHFAGLGARLFLLGRQPDRLTALNNELGGGHTILTADLTSPQEFCAALKKHLSSWKISVVLHTAGGGLGLRDPLLSEEELIRLFQVNLSGAVAINRIIVPFLKDIGGGNVIHVGSIASSEGVGSVGYNTVKAALAAYVRSLGREVAESNVIVSGILPGGFHAKDNAMERLRLNKPEVYDEFVNTRLPRKKMGTAQELLPLLEFLCSKGAGMMSGCLVPIDGAEGRAYLTEA